MGKPEICLAWVSGKPPLSQRWQHHPLLCGVLETEVQREGSKSSREAGVMGKGFQEEVTVAAVGFGQVEG